MYIKTYKTDKHFMVAACDKELIGQTLKNEACEMKVNASFYQGEEGTEEMLEVLLMQATTANLTGKKAVACAVKCGIVDPNSAIYFDEIPHALYFTL
ncbi:hypothetical protein MmiHf6_17730 [Methanimicrococcus hongohii]|uniref:DUF424 domain-containing protein n=1 Tax=Methanimicrococcus hongohii TaxID=3028295 RepID=A0AA96VCW8_9EURY|nr:DUF424 family protein [Methanimicrococcus sp. Hf6]WNY24437.1 hypothetical protein MmiHf6_17730 [Methanimicrococcus sp. Hf6]